jgi:protein-S-isoprenylcysteine O-methyltransferase Ste14
MDPRLEILFPALWAAWALYWWAASFDVKPTARRESMASRLSHIVPLALAVALLASRAAPPIPGLALRWLPQAVWPAWLGALLTATGLAFTVWARRVLGRNWSAVVTLKSDHQLVTTGPYRYARHPIYTGLLLAVAGSAMARGDVRALLAIALAGAAFWRKLRIEEAWLRERFGSDYDAYAQRVAALVPKLL